MSFESFRVNFAYRLTAEKARLLPARMNPLPDELLSSWLVRLAMAHGLKLHSFCVAIFGRHTSIWNRDIDKLANDKVLQIISERTDVSLEQVFQTTLADFGGKIYETHNPFGNTVWIMPLRIYHRQRRRNGLQLCPFCLREDIEPYYRRQWRLSWVSICERHKTVLIDNCPECFNPIIFHRHDLGNRNQSATYSMIECSFCRSIWTSKRVLSTCIRATKNSIRFQKMLNKVVKLQWGEIQRFGMVHSISYFKGLKQILRILSVCNRSDAFREEVSRRSHIKLQKNVKEMSFDLLSVERRYQVLRAADWILTRWADEFINIAKSTKTWSSILLPQNNDAPFWYWSVIKEKLTRDSYGASEAEIISALSILEKKSQIQRIYISLRHLKQLMQNNDILQKKSAKFKIEIYGRIKIHNQQILSLKPSF